MQTGETIIVDAHNLEIECLNRCPREHGVTFTLHTRLYFRQRHEPLGIPRNLRLDVINRKTENDTGKKINPFHSHFLLISQQRLPHAHSV